MAASPRRPGFVTDLSTAPNIITLSRIVLILAGAGLVFGGYIRSGMAVAIVGGLTDYLDGWWARRTGQVTWLGELLDQFCDFFFESIVVFIVVAQFHFLPMWVMIAYLSREMWSTTIRRFMAGHQLNIASNLLGKMKTNFLLWGTFPSFLSMFGYLQPLEPALGYIGKGSMLLGITLGYASAVDYTRQLIVGYDKIAAARATGAATAAGDGAGH
jgi:CDP-diacylglycerol--glycerol-3-phosphate 3-phosphatidyltransferase